jgi:hypothetical protein
MNRSRIKQTAIAALACASVAAVIGIATGAAAPSSSDKTKSRSEFGLAPGGGPPIGLRAVIRNDGRPKVLSFTGGARRAVGGPPVHSEMVVPTKSGDDFETITQDSGKVDSVSSSQLTITEGTDQATYKTVTLDIPADAQVIRDGRKADLGDLRQGDQVHVSQSPQDTFVFAADSSYAKKLEKCGPLPPGVDGFPPGLPPMAYGRRGH